MNNGSIYFDRSSPQTPSNKYDQPWLADATHTLPVFTGFPIEFEQYFGEIKNDLFLIIKPEIILSELLRRFCSATVQTKALIHTIT